MNGAKTNSIQQVYKIDIKYAIEYELSQAEVKKETKCFYFLGNDHGPAFRWSNRIRKEEAFLTPEEAIVDARSRLIGIVRQQSKRLHNANDSLDKFNAIFGGKS